MDGERIKAGSKRSGKKNIFTGGGHSIGEVHCRSCNRLRTFRKYFNALSQAIFICDKCDSLMDIPE